MESRKKYRWNDLQSRNRDAAVDNKHGYQEGKRGWNGLEIGIDICSVVCGDLNGKEIQKRGDICIYIAASLCCTAEAKHSIVKQLYYCKVISLQLK